MKILINDTLIEFHGDTLSQLLVQAGYGSSKVATAVNETFVSGVLRDLHMLNPGDRVEIVAPKQGG